MLFYRGRRITSCKTIEGTKKEVSRHAHTQHAAMLQRLCHAMLCGAMLLKFKLLFLYMGKEDAWKACPCCFGAAGATYMLLGRKVVVRCCCCCHAAMLILEKAAYSHVHREGKLCVS